MPGHSATCLTSSFRDLPPALPELMKRQADYQGHIQVAGTYICAVFTQMMAPVGLCPLGFTPWGGQDSQISSCPSTHQRDLLNRQGSEWEHTTQSSSMQRYLYPGPHRSTLRTS